MASDSTPRAFKITVRLEPREDGGMRAWSEEVPELVLSSAQADRLLQDIPIALRVILREKLGREVDLRELSPLPMMLEAAMAGPRQIREFAALAA